MKTMFAALFAMYSLSASADSVSVKEISCGDHWFSVDVVFSDGQPVVTISGDSVTGEDPVYNAEHSVTQDDAGVRWAFTFGDGSDTAQILDVTFQSGDLYGSGLYRFGADGIDINMNCLRR